MLLKKLWKAKLLKAVRNKSLSEESDASFVLMLEESILFMSVKSSKFIDCSISAVIFLSDMAFWMLFSQLVESF